MGAEFEPERFLLPHIARMGAYTPIQPFEVVSRRLGRRPEDIVKLDANENPYGPVAAIREAIAAYPFLHIYPDPEQGALRDALAEYTGAPAANILPGSGADELIDLLTRLATGPGDAVVDAPPTFGMYRFDAELAGANAVQVWRKADFSLDLDAIEAAVLEPAGGVRPKLLFLTSPNNPDGGLLPPDDLARLLRLPVLVVLDEAYIEFAGLELSAGARVPGMNNLVVLRTFSKWAGLAGLRLGYGIFPNWLMPALWRAKQPYNVNVAATAAGLAALAHRAEIQCTVDALVRERERMTKGLRGIPYLAPMSSRANFVLCRVVERDALALKQELARRGVLVRHYDKPGVANCIRISAGRPADIDAVLAALKALA